MRYFAAATILLALTAHRVCAREDILIADFESKDYGDWQTTGEAFGSGPSRGTLAGQMQVSGYRGKGLVNSFYKGDGSTGTLTSPAFTIQRRYINFLIGGGKYPGRTCINLLVDGDAVRTATGPNDRPGGSEMLDWHAWDVSELEGSEARIQIIDQRTGGWGHINVDHIVQSDRKIERVDLTREIHIDKRYLNLPVAKSLPKHYIDVLVDGRIVREFDMKLATPDTEPDFWVFLDMKPFMGRTATVKLMNSWAMDNRLDVISLDDSIKNAETFYKEKHRPQFHFSSRRGWNNDSNGLVWYKGEYHLFYQHNPYGWPWGNMTWGHAVSRDLVHWEELGDAIHPDELGTIFSGSAVIDHNNTSGFQTGDEKPLVCIYTYAGGRNLMSRGEKFTQAIAYSNDRGRTFTKYEGNPVIEHIKAGNRDPKVIWHEPTEQWSMVLYLDDREMGFFTSDNLRQWDYHGKMECFHECPELFELPVNGNADNCKWVLYGASGDYLLGDFDGEMFHPESEPIRFHYGNAFYASQTFNNIPAEDGRRIQIAWGRSATPEMPFNQCMLFPVTLALHETEDGLRMFANPVREIELLQDRRHLCENHTLKPSANPLKAVRGDLFHIRAEISPQQAEQVGFDLRGVEVLYDVDKQQLACRGRTAPLKLHDGRITLEILLDRTTIEIFGNDGRMYMPVASIPDDDNRSLGVFCRGGDAHIDMLEVFELRSVWPK